MRYLAIILLLASSLSGCRLMAEQAQDAPEVIITEEPEAVITPEPQATDEPVSSGNTGNNTSYVDPNAGFSIIYPASWYFQTNSGGLPNAWLGSFSA